jgi:crossover junction endodeoxyribonuclease RuvC
MTLVIGIDPGLTGAIAAVEGETLRWVEDMPRMGDEVNTAAFNAYYAAAEYGPWHLDAAGTCTPIAIEKVAANGKNGSIANFKLGGAYHACIAYFTARGHRIDRITPGDWKKTFGLYGIGRDDAKEAARKKAIELWPADEKEFRLKTRPDRAEAALIALHHSRRLARDAGGVDEYQAEIRRLHAELDAVRGGDAA